MALVKLFLKEMLDLLSSPWKLQGQVCASHHLSSPCQALQVCTSFFSKVASSEMLLAGEDEVGDLHPCGALQPENTCSWHCLGMWRGNTA